MNPRRQRAAWAAVTIAGVLLAFAPAVAGVRTLSQRDTDLLYGPIRTLVVAELRAGRLPLWNPYEGTGKPLFAEGIHSVLHPISLAAAAVAPSSVDFLILAYLLSAALGALVLGSTLGASPAASAGGAVAFALSGFSASMTGNLVFLAGLSTLPWLAAAARAAGAGARWGIVATALATGCAFLSGDAQAALVGLALGTLLAADAGGARGAARALVGMGAGILLAGVQLAATSELLPRTYRSLELPDEQKTKWALAPGRLLEWVIPGLCRGPLDEVPVAPSGAWLDPVFAESVYLGVPLLVAAAIGASARYDAGRRRTGLVLAGAATILLWLALGHHLGARQLLDAVPIWSRFRYSEKLMGPLSLCAAALAALGADAFAAAPLSRAWRRGLAAAALTAGAVLLAVSRAPAPTQAIATRLLGDAGPFYHYTLGRGLPHLVIGLAALLVVDRLRSRRARTTALAALLALAPAAAVYHGAHLGSPAVRRTTSPLRLEADAPTARIVHLQERFVGGDEPDGPVEASARVEALFLGPSLNVARRVDTIEPYGAFEPGRVTTLARSFGDGWWRAFRRFGLTHVVLQTRPRPEPDPAAAAFAVEGGRLVQRDERLGLELWAVPHRPWAFFARRALATERPQAAHRVLLDLMERGDDGTVVVEAPAPPATAPGRVLRVERGTDTVRVEAESLGPALLVVQDAYWPGWRASIDGQPAEVLAADVLVRAVRWPPGRHRLELVYAPRELQVGLALSAVGAVLVLLLGVQAARRELPVPVR
ncbi:YfhO family protein [Anaeromyxobacter oryzisoli]|uniref:YfhO family protein n=1 Tax=Anaeromyxobacter oryzisoli TaxID=2925408 RepID=UPI001F56E89D|nr:YfhO family protein [Anaeromyxobacter sp. SG63]